MRGRNLSPLGVALLLLLAAPGFAQRVSGDGASGATVAAPNVATSRTASDPPLNSPQQWGTSAWQTYTVTALDAALRSGSWADANGSYVQSATGTGLYVGYPVHLPSGAVVEYVRIFYNETNTGNPIGAGFWKYDLYGPGTVVQVAAPPAINTGDSWVDFGPFSEVVNNDPTAGSTYSILAYLDGTTKIYKFTLWYVLQVSPAPGTATFTDVPTNYWAFQYIEALAASGITAGCGGGNFCPEQYVKRSEMAVFLSKALGLYWGY